MNKRYHVRLICYICVGLLRSVRTLIAVVSMQVGYRMYKPRSCDLIVLLRQQIHMFYSVISYAKQTAKLYSELRHA